MTTENKHTAGPWRLETLTTRSGRNKLALTASNFRICDISVYNEQDHANARLIAAAPELIEALRKISAEDSCSPVIAYVARAAIAKATGETVT